MALHAGPEHLPEPEPAAARARDPPHGHRHHRHRPGALLQVHTPAARPGTCRAPGSLAGAGAWGLRPRRAGGSCVGEGRGDQLPLFSCSGRGPCSRRSWTSLRTTRTRRAGWSTSPWRPRGRRSSCEQLILHPQTRDPRVPCALKYNHSCLKGFNVSTQGLHLLVFREPARAPRSSQGSAVTHSPMSLLLLLQGGDSGSPSLFRIPQGNVSVTALRGTR